MTTSKPVPPLAAVDGETNVSTRERKTEDDELHESPEPAAAAAAAVLGSLLALVLVANVVLFGRGAGAGLA
jgi:hypothetical protein